MTVKRLVDVVASTTLLVALSPLLAAVAAAVRVLSGRPVLYRATRVGLHGEPFEMLKFRTMVVDPVASDAGTGAAVTGPQDPRVTRVGRWIRSGRLDELPQLLNVLRGEMSLVGPRPEDPRFVAGYTDEQRQVLTARPGLTSPTALRYRHEADLLPADPGERDAFYARVLLPAKLESDLDYVRSRSLLGDARVLWATLRALTGGGAATVVDPAPPGSRRIVVLGAVDGFANGVRTREVTRLLEHHGHRVSLVDTGRISRLSPDASSWRSRLPRPTPSAVALFAVEAAGRLIRSREGLRGRLSHPQLLAELHLRARLLRGRVDLAGVDLVMVETPHDTGFLATVREARTWYDCPTPWADELALEGRLTTRQHTRLRARERAAMERVDVLSFHWHTYADYARQEYGLTRPVQRLDWGCHPRERRTAPAHPGTPARVVYLGSLGSRFIDLDLLSRLSQAYPHIDVFGGPPPDPALGLAYRGWATPDVLDDYQFGIVTCTDDPLRRSGFSAKHLEYLAAGLPVLVPEWRTVATELAGTIPYDEAGFAEAVAAHSAPRRWSELSEQAHAQARQLAWDRTLTPLDDVLRSLPARSVTPVRPPS